MTQTANHDVIAPNRKWPVPRLRLNKLPRAVRISITTVLVLTATIFGVWAFLVYEYSPWTRDGRISAYVVDTAPEVSGLVIDVPVQDNQFVHKGDLLYKIDPRDYEAALKRSQAAVDAARAKLDLEKENLDRRMKLRPGDVSAQERQSYATAVQADQADLDAAQAALYRAQIDLERCEIRSPVNGWVTNLTVRTGNYAVTGQRQLSVIDADSYWISGYFEETRLKNIRVGDPARAELMGYPNDKISGHVESLNRGIADTNTAPNPQGLPQVNPIFTWVRLAQRIPVRIHIDKVPDGVHLAIGETCTVNIEPSKR
jgi:multidrug resistance efflux pump